MKQELLGLTLILSILLVGCNLPFGGESAPEAESETEQQVPAEELQEQEAPDEQAAAGAEPTPVSFANPILHIERGRQIIITHIEMVSDSLGWAIGGLEGASDHVFHTNDGGSSWRDVTPGEPRPEPGEPGKIAVGAFLNAQSGWVLYYPDTVEPLQLELRVWSTQNAGESWTASRPLELEFLGTNEYPPRMGFQDTEHGWLMARHGPVGMFIHPVYFLRTADGGRTWDALVAPPESGLQSCRKSGIDFADTLVGWITVDNCPTSVPELTVTSDGGRTWQPRSLPAPANRPDLFKTEICLAHSPQMLTPQHGALAVSCRTGLKLNLVYITRDGGATWTSHLYPGGELILLNQRTAYVVGDKKIYQSVDGGQNWEWVKTVEWDGQFSFVSDLVGWAVARTGQGTALVNTTNGAQTWGLLKPQIAP